VTVLDWNAVAQTSVAHIVDCLVAGTVISLFARLLLALGRRPSAGARFAVWFSALLAIAALGFASPAVSGGSGMHVAVTAGHPVLLLPASLAVYLFASWAAIAAGLLFRVGLGLFHLRALRRSCVTLGEDSLRLPLRETLARQSGSRPVELCLSEQVHVPTAIGFFRPAVVLPRFLVNELSPAELNQVLLHELAHLRRWDDWTNLAQQIVKAVLFFHPAVWWIEKKISLEREMACDDAVLAETASPRAYAECLAHLAEKSFLRRSMVLAQAAVGRIRQTSLRVAQILDVNRPAGNRQAWKPVVVLVAGFTIACAVGVARAPRLVAFEENPAPQAGNKSLMVALTTSPAAAPVHTASWNHALAVRPARARKPRAKADLDSTASNRTARNGVREASAALPTNSLPDAEQRVQPVAFHTAPATVPAFFVVVEGYEFNSSGQPVYQISVWRIAVQNPVRNQVGTINPRKT
jgi:beta-lactamase regulating signal transducer with metallopeptidase domain